MAAVKQSRFIVLLATIGVVGLVVVVVGLYFFNMQLRSIAAMQNAADVLQEECNGMQADLDSLDGKKAELKALEAELAILDKHKIDYEYMPTYLAQLQKTCKVTGNTIQTIQPHEIKPLDLSGGPLSSGDKKDAVPPPGITETVSDTGAAAPAPAKPKGPQYRVQQIVLEVRGTYVTVFKLLNALRQFPKMIYVRSVGLTPLTNDRMSRPGELVAHLETFAIISPEQYQKAKAEEPAKPQPAAAKPGVVAPAKPGAAPTAAKPGTAPAAPAKPAPAPKGGSHE
jgi:Tfp pilus assembly protein PilO